MRFCLIGPAYPYRGGIVHHTAMLAEQLQQQGHEVILIAYADSYPRWLFPGKSVHDPSNTPLRTEVKYRISPWQPWTWGRWAKIIAQEQPQAVIIEWWVPFWAPLQITLAKRLRRLGVPVFMDCQNVLPHSPNKLSAAITAYTLGQGEACMVYSQAHQQELHDLLPTMSDALVPYPVYGAMTHSRMSRTQARQELNVTGPVMMFFGFVRPYKGLSILLRAMAKVRSHLPVSLLIVGEFWRGSDEERRLIEELGLAPYTIVVDKYVPDEALGLYFAAADVLVMPYREPVQSGVLAVAQGFQIPVIASNVGGLSDYIEVGKTGLLVEPNDPTALAKAIQTFFEEELRQQMLPHVQAIGQDDGWREVVAAWEALAQPS